MQSRRDALADLCEARGEPPYRLKQLEKALYQTPAMTYSAMTFLPAALRQALSAAQGDNVLSLEPLTERVSTQATKILFRLRDGQTIETVRMRYRKGHVALCISSQVGCALGCTFCATATAGLQRNLTAEEITDQVLYFRKRGDRIKSVSFMGMGEPLANPETLRALTLLRDPERLNVGLRRVSLSTVGLAPALKRVSERFPQLNLSFSLHSPFPEERSVLMPINKAYAPAEVFAALDEHLERTRRKVFVAYMVIAGFNDTPAHARALVGLLRGRHALEHLYHVNLLRYNPARGVSSTFSTREANLEAFRAQLVRAGLNVTVRQSFGSAIDAACGQLYAAQRQRKELPYVRLE